MEAALWMMNVGLVVYTSLITARNYCLVSVMNSIVCLVR